MSGQAHAGWQPNTAALFSVVLLKNRDEFLLLRRADSKSFAPGKWTGIGGKIEVNELDDIRSGALRELAEESGIRPDQLTGLTLRRMVLVPRPNRPVSLLCYYTGNLIERVTPACPEGELFWKRADEIQALDLVDTARPVLPLLVEDMLRDPLGLETVRCAVAFFDEQAIFQHMIWAG